MNPIADQIMLVSIKPGMICTTPGEINQLVFTSIMIGALSMLLVIVIIYGVFKALKKKQKKERNPWEDFAKKVKRQAV